MDTKIFDYKEESDKWYNEVCKLYEEGKIEEEISFNEQYLLSLKGRYNEEGPGSLAFDILKSLIIASFDMKRFNYALEKALELMSLDLSAIKRYDDGEGEFYVGAIYYELGNYEQAAKYLKIAKKKSQGRSLDLFDTDTYKKFLKSLDSNKSSEHTDSQKLFDRLYKIFKDDDVSEDVHSFIINMVKSGFFSVDEMLYGIKNFVEYNYEEYFQKTKSKALKTLVEEYNEIYSNKKEPVNFNRLKSAFDELREKGLIVQHGIGNTEDEALEASQDEYDSRKNNGENIIGYCLYTMQSLFNLFENDSDRLMLSFGNIEENPDALSIGKLIKKSLENNGFEVTWNENAETKIAVKIDWDNCYNQ